MIYSTIAISVLAALSAMTHSTVNSFVIVQANSVRTNFASLRESVQPGTEQQQLVDTIEEDEPIPATVQNKGLKRIPTQVVVGAFADDDNDQNGAGAKASAAAAALDALLITTNVAIITNSKDGEITIDELGGNHSPQEGAFVGELAGGAFGSLIGGLSMMFLGPVGIASGMTTGSIAGSIMGSQIGEAAAIHIDGMSKDKLDELSSVLTPGSSAFVAVLDEIMVNKEDLTTMEAVISTRDELLRKMESEIAESLAKKEDVGFLVAADNEGGIHMTKVEGEKASEPEKLLLMPASPAIEAAIDQNPEEAKIDVELAKE